MMEFSNIEKLITEINTLQKAHEILRDIYIILGPYATIVKDKNNMDVIRIDNDYNIEKFDSCMRDLNSYFDFDDSE